MSKASIEMKQLDKRDLEEFLRLHKEVVIGKNKLRIGETKKIKQYQPQEFQLEKTNVWSFPKRGNWATHKSNFRGNWAPQIPRNLILRYSKPEETVLDQMCGSGTTLIECKLLGRNGIGVDINENCVILALDRLNFKYDSLDPDFPKTKQTTYVGDARNLNLIQNETIDLIATHPPYANIVSYSTRAKRVSGDLSFARSLEQYLIGIKEVAKESYRVLKLGRYCAVLIGDTRRRRHHVPIAFKVLQEFQSAGFILREDVVKIQWKTKITREKWKGLSKTAQESWVEESKRRFFTDFFLLSYEHLFIFRKPSQAEDLKIYKNSMKLPK